MFSSLLYRDVFVVVCCGLLCVSCVYCFVCGDWWLFVLLALCVLFGRLFGWLVG